MDLGLSGAGALVTGGSRGIGRAVARALVAEGARVALLGRDRAALAAAVDELGGDAVAVEADTTDDAQVRRAVEEAARRLGSLEVVVNCAAARAKPGSQGLDALDERDFLHQLDTKPLGYLRVVRAAVPHLAAAGGGGIVNVSGMNARLTGSITGSVRNTAVVALSKNLADELGPRGIRVSCVHPGLTLHGEDVDEEMCARSAAGSSLGRPITADDVAALVVFLASPLGAVASGSVISADGGRPGAIWA